MVGSLTPCYSFCDYTIGDETMLTIRGHLANEALKPIIAAALLEYRSRWNLTQEAMARTLSMCCRSYIDLEHGDRLPSATTLALFLTKLEPSEQEIMLEKLRHALDTVKASQKAVD